MPEAATPMTMTGAFIVISLTMLGLLGWLMKRVFDKTIPDLQSGFTVETDAQRKAHLEDANANRKLYREAIKEERDACDARHKEVTDLLARQWEQQQSERRDGMSLLRAIQQTLLQGTRLQAVVTASEDAIWTKTTEGVLTSWNKAAEGLLGWRANDVIGKSMFMIVPTDLHQQEQDVLDRLKGGEKVDHYRTERLHRDGRRVRVDISISPVRDPSGQVIHIGSIAREV